MAQAQRTAEASTGVQQLVLWAAALVFFLAAFPPGVTVLNIGRRLSPGDLASASPRR